MATAALNIKLPRLPQQPRFDFRRRIPALDGLRGIAILAVFFHNYGGGFLRNQAALVRSEGTLKRLLSEILGATLGFGWTGVALFFVLSGFLITGILYDTRLDSGYYKKFYARRALRIFPVYYAFAAVLLIAGAFVQASWHRGDLWFLVYLGFPAAFLSPTILQVAPSLHFTHIWSLCVEEQFYLLWPTMIARFTKPSSILRFCGILVWLSVIFRTTVWLAGWPIGSWSYAFLLGRMDELAIGAALAILMRNPHNRRMLLRWAGPGFLASGLATAAICLIRHSVDSSDALISTLGYTIIGFACGALLLLSLRSGSMLASLLSGHWLRMFGKYSYGIYVYHAALAVPLATLKVPFVKHVHSFLVGSGLHLILCLAVNLAVAAISFHLMEVPVMNRKSRVRYSIEMRETAISASA